MASTALNKDLTLTAIFTGSAVLVLEIERILGFFSKSLEDSPFVAIFNELKPEVCVVIALVLFSQSNILRNFVADYDRTRLNWLGRRIPIGKDRHLFVEEAIFLLVVATLFIVSTVYLVDGARKSYSRYGLIYIARAQCQGRFDLALSRTEAIKNNPLWSRYEVELTKSIPRLKYLAAERPAALSALQTSVDAASPVEKLSLLVGAKAIFGVTDARRYIGGNLGSEQGPILERWRNYLIQDSCP